MILALLPLARAADLEVCNIYWAEEGCVETLEAAIEMAQDGDTIYVDYTEVSSSVTLVDRTLNFTSFGEGSTLWFSEDEAALTVEGGQITVTGMTFVSGRGGAIHQTGGELIITSSHFFPGVRYGDGGAVRVEGSGTLTIQDSSFKGGNIIGGGAHVMANESDLVIDNCIFEEGEASYGSSVWITSADVTVTDSEFLRNDSTVGFGALTVSGVSETVAIITGNRFDGNTGSPGGAFVVTGTAVVSDNLFIDNSSNEMDFWGYGVESALLVDAGELEVMRNTFCGNSADTELLLGTTARVHGFRSRITNNIFLENFNGSLVVADSTDTHVWNNAFVGNTSPYGAQLILAESNTNVVADVRRNLFALNTDGYGGLGPILTFSDWHTFAENLFWGNLPESALADEGSSVVGDPRLVSYVADGACRVPRSFYDFDELWPGWDSPVRDGGSATSADDLDLDGSAPDIGPFGGPDARFSPDWVDGDADGVPNLYDCVTLNAEFSPIAEDPPYDGVDSNCDGASDFDADGDGQDAQAYGGLDCDDQAAAVFLGAEEIPYDGVDQSCDGADLVDVDGDGYSAGVDCDDRDDRVHPGAADLDVATDWDCDGFGDPRSELTRVGCSTPGAPVIALALLAVAGLRRRRG